MSTRPTTRATRSRAATGFKKSHDVAGAGADVSLQTGSLNWSFSTDTPNDDCVAIKSPVAVNDRLFFAGLDGAVYSLDAATGRVVWKRKLTAAPATSLVFRDKSLYVGTTDQYMPGTVEVKWPRSERRTVSRNGS